MCFLPFGASFIRLCSLEDVCCKLVWNVLENVDWSLDLGHEQRFMGCDVALFFVGEIFSWWAIPIWWSLGRRWRLFQAHHECCTCSLELWCDLWQGMGWRRRWINTDFRLVVIWSAVLYRFYFMWSRYDGPPRNCHRTMDTGIGWKAAGLMAWFDRWKL